MQQGRGKSLIFIFTLKPFGPKLWKSKLLVNTESQTQINKASILTFRMVELVWWNNYLKAVSSRQLPLCCVVCNTKIQRVKNNKNNNNNNITPTSNRKSLPSSVSGYSLSKSISNYSILFRKAKVSIWCLLRWNVIFESETLYLP